MIKTTMFFDSRYKPDDLAELMYDIKTRINWDKTAIYDELTRISQNISTYYVVYKGILLVKDRDFVEKRMLFKYDDKIYAYFSSGPNEVGI